MPKSKQPSKKSKSPSIRDLSPKRSKVKGGNAQFNPKELTITQTVPWKK